MNQSLGYRGGAFFGVDHSLAGFRDKRNREARDEDLLANMKVRNKLFAHIAEYGDEVTEPSLSLKVMVADVSMRIQKFLDTVTSAQSSVDNQQQPIFQPNQLDLSPLSERWNELVRAVNPYLTGPNNQLLSDSDSDQLKQMITTQLMAPVQKLKTDIAQRLQSLGLFGRLSSLVINADVLFGSGYNSIENQIEDKYYLPVRFGPQRGQIQMGVPGPAQQPAQLPGGFPGAPVGPPGPNQPTIPFVNPIEPVEGLVKGDMRKALNRMREAREPGEPGPYDVNEHQLEGVYDILPGEIQDARIWQKSAREEEQEAEKRRATLRQKFQQLVKRGVEKQKQREMASKLERYEEAILDAREVIMNLENKVFQRGEASAQEISALRNALEAQRETENRLRAELSLAQRRESPAERAVIRAAEQLASPPSSVASASSYRSAQSVSSPFSSTGQLVPIEELAKSAGPRAGPGVVVPSNSGVPASFKDRLVNFFKRSKDYVPTGTSPFEAQSPPAPRESLARVDDAAPSSASRNRLQEFIGRVRGGPDEVLSPSDRGAEARPSSQSGSPYIESVPDDLRARNLAIFQNRGPVKNYRQRLVSFASRYSIPVGSLASERIVHALSDRDIELPENIFTAPGEIDTGLLPSATAPVREKRASVRPSSYGTGKKKMGEKKTDYRGPMDFGENKKVTGGKMNPKHKYIDLTALCKSQGYIGKGKRRLPKESYEGFNDDNNDLFNIPAPMQPKDERMKQELKHMPILMGNKGLPKIYGRERQLKNLGFYKPGPYREHRE